MQEQPGALQQLMQRVHGQVLYLLDWASTLCRRGPEAQVLRSRVSIIVAACLVLAYAIGVVHHVLTTPEIGIRCAFTPKVNRFNGDFLYPKGQEPLQVGDTVVQIGKDAIASWAEILEKLKSLRQTSDDQLTTVESLAQLGLEKNNEGWAAESEGSQAPPEVILEENAGKSRHLVRVVYERPDSSTRGVVWCRVGHPPPSVLVPSVLWFFVKVGLFVVGALVYWNRPEDRSIRLFFWFCTISFGANVGGHHWHLIVTEPVLLLVFVVCAVLLPAVSLHFYLIFPRCNPLMERWPGRMLIILYGPALLFLLLLLLDYFQVWYAHDQKASPEVVQKLLNLALVKIYCYLGVAMLWYLASIVSLGHSYRTAHDATERNQVKWILYGLLAALLPIGYSFMMAWTNSAKFGSGGATWPMFTASLIVTVSYTISITRYRLMQLDQIVSSGFVYFLISFLAGLGYYGLVFVGMVLVGSRWDEGPSFTQVLSVSATALLLLLALDLIRGRLKRALDRHYRREKHQLDHTLHRMKQAIEQLVEPPALARRFLHTSMELLGVHRGAVYLRQEKPGLYQLVSHLGTSPALTELSAGCPLIETLGVRGILGQSFPEPSANGSSVVGIEGAQRQLAYLGGGLAQGFLHEGELLGFVVLGEKARAPYSSEDLHLLGAFAQITTLALVSAEGHRTIETLNRELQNKVEKIAEQQRRILVLQSQLMNRGQKSDEEGLQEESLREPTQEANRTEHFQTPASGLEPSANGEAVRPTKDQVAHTREVHSPANRSTGNGQETPTDRFAERRPVHQLVGSSPPVLALLQVVRKVATSDSAVLLRGESGTGKEVLARIIHENSPRKNRPFIKVHCAALSPGLLESELFGHVKGAFTNAIRDKVGRFEAAHEGTVFLDEIGDVSLEVQTKLLRVLQEKTFERVGSSEPVRVDVRIIAATHQNLETLMGEGRFRQDLFYRLNVFPITLPPLRERAEDIPELVMHFLRIYGERMGKQRTRVEDIDPDALALLKAYSWPGNIRQLENVIERAVVIAEGNVIGIEELPPELRESPLSPPSGRFPVSPHAMEGTPGDLSTEEQEAGSEVSLSRVASTIRAERTQRERREREQLVRALAAAGGNKAEAARALGLARSTLVSRLKRLGLS